MFILELQCKFHEILGRVGGVTHSQGTTILPNILMFSSELSKNNSYTTSLHFWSCTCKILQIISVNQQSLN